MASNPTLSNQVAALEVEVQNLRGAVETNGESLADVRDGFQRLRGEINGSLPRIEQKLERVITQLDSRAATDREYFEKVQIHENEIGTLFTQLTTKADAAANANEHKRLWQVVKIFLAGTFSAVAGLVLLKLFG